MPCKFACLWVAQAGAPSRRTSGTRAVLRRLSPVALSWASTEPIRWRKQRTDVASLPDHQQIRPFRRHSIRAAPVAEAPARPLSIRSAARARLMTTSHSDDKLVRHQEPVDHRSTLQAPPLPGAALPSDAPTRDSCAMPSVSAAGADPRPTAVTFPTTEHARARCRAARSSSGSRLPTAHPPQPPSPARSAPAQRTTDTCRGDHDRDEDERQVQIRSAVLGAICGTGRIRGRMAGAWLVAVGSPEPETLAFVDRREQPRERSELERLSLARQARPGA